MRRVMNRKVVKLAQPLPDEASMDTYLAELKDTKAIVLIGKSIQNGGLLKSHIARLAKIDEGILSQSEPEAYAAQSSPRSKEAVRVQEEILSYLHQDARLDTIRSLLNYYYSDDMLYEALSVMYHNAGVIRSWVVTGKITCIANPYINEGEECKWLQSLMSNSKLTRTAKILSKHYTLVDHTRENIRGLFMNVYNEAIYTSLLLRASAYKDLLRKFNAVNYMKLTSDVFNILESSIVELKEINKFTKDMRLLIEAHDNMHLEIKSHTSTN